MLISDWSSDVCSSDLVNIISSASFTIYLVHILPVHLLRFQLHVDNVPLIVLVAMGIGVLINGIRPRKLMTLVLDRLPMRSRSEEHTSELQSLMRISYAVFCLKKKKKKNQYTTYTR